MFCKKDVLRNFTKFTEKYLFQSLFFNKVASLTPVTLLKKGRWHRFFVVNFVKFLRTLFTWNTSVRDASTYWTSAYGHCLIKETTSNLFNQRPFFSVKSTFSWSYFPRTYYSNNFHPHVFSIVLFLRVTKSNFQCWFQSLPASIKFDLQTMQPILPEWHYTAMLHKEKHFQRMAKSVM